MRRQPDGGWVLQVPLHHGHHLYQFLVDGTPVLDPKPRAWDATPAINGFAAGGELSRQIPGSADGGCRMPDPGCGRRNAAGQSVGRARSPQRSAAAVAGILVAHPAVIAQRWLKVGHWSRFNVRPPHPPWGRWRQTHAPDAGVDHGARAHRAGFFGHIERTIVEPPVPDRSLGLRQGQHLGVGRGVLEQFDLVEGAADHGAGPHDHSAHRHLVSRVGTPRLPERLVHEMIVAMEVNDGRRPAPSDGAQRTVDPPGSRPGVMDGPPADAGRDSSTVQT